MRKFFYLSFLFLFAVGCSRTEDTSQSPAKDVNFTLSTKSLPSSITNCYLFFYKNDTLVKTTLINDNISLDLPLAQALTVVAVANPAQSATGTDFLSTLKFSVGANFDKECFYSDPKQFVCDGGTPNVELSVNRKVGAICFQPYATEDVSAITEFDSITVSFNNIVVGYTPGAAASNREEIAPLVMNLTKDGGFKSDTYYAFPKMGVTFTIDYFKNGTKVYTSEKAFPAAGLEIKANELLTVKFPLTEDGGYWFPLTRSFAPVHKAMPEVKVIYSNL